MKKELKTGRNDPCICGTGKKYKYCCMEIVKENSLFDLMNKKIIKIDGAKLIKRVFSHNTDIEKSFQEICDLDIIRVSRYHSLAMNYISTTLEYENKFDNITKLLISILMNLTLSISASAELINRGYKLEPGLIFRNIYERVSFIIYLIYNPENVKAAKKEKINSTKTISFAKKIINNIGLNYGLLSKHFVHLGELHKLPSSLKPYTKNDPALNINITFLKLSTWLFYVVTELVCFDYIKLKKYWIKDSGKYLFCPFENELLTAFGYVGHNFLSDDISVRKNK